MKNTNIIKTNYLFGIFYSVPMKFTNIRKRFCQIDFFFFFFQPSFTCIKVKETNFKTYGEKKNLRLKN
jgi:hypothetical protein